jgi:hypothetical protein
MNDMYEPTHPVSEYGTLNQGAYLKHFLLKGGSVSSEWIHDPRIEYRVKCPVCLPIVREALSVAVWFVEDKDPGEKVSEPRADQPTEEPT